MSDHISSPRAVADPACDIADLFAFPSPERPGYLVLVMSVFPRAGPSALFSDAVLCRFRLRPASIAGAESKARFAVGPDKEELVFDCTFSEPSVQPGSGQLRQVGTCTAPTGDQVTVTVHDQHGGSGEGLKMFAGLTSDPFIFQLEWIVETLKTGRIASPKIGKNTMEDANVLGLVLEVEYRKWLHGGPLFAVVGETLAAGKRPLRLERVGRPEIKNIGMQFNGYDTVNRDIDVRELYNQEDAFHVGNEYLGAYRARLSANLKFYDGLDGKIDWPPDENGNHPLVDLLLEDFLVVDVSKPFSENSWFEIERAMLDGHAHETCGGRALNDDFLDTYYTLFINRGNGPRISDGVDQATVPASNVFPYLAPANPSKPKASADKEEKIA
jgi:Domain of unknown function (DUF4331)